MKKVITFLFVLFLLSLYDTEVLSDTVYNIYDKYIVKHNYIITSNSNTLKQNNYHTDSYSSVIKDTDDFLVNNKTELINVYYTAVNKGYSDLTFYCSTEYNECMNDINSLDSENGDFSIINQLVNVYNSYSSIESSYYNNKRVDIKIKKRYTDDDINRINKRIDEIIIETNINNESNIKNKIKLFHDYLIDHNKYDQDMEKNGKSDYHSDSAIGPLFEGKAVCSGYSDAMSLFLDKIKVKNIRISTSKHVWNGINIDNKWYHLDLTWDDPIVSNGSDIISYNYYLISTDELLQKDSEHNFDRNVYSFIK